MIVQFLVLDLKKVQLEAFFKIMFWIQARKPISEKKIKFLSIFSLLQSNKRYLIHAVHPKK